MPYGHGTLLTLPSLIGVTGIRTRAGEPIDARSGANLCRQSRDTWDYTLTELSRFANGIPRSITGREDAGRRARPIRISKHR